jgi:heme exporter protein A
VAARIRLLAEAISAFRGDRLILDRISFEVAAGGALVLLGPNGAGKSTLLRAVAGLKRLDGGRLLFDGSDDWGDKIAYLGHQDGIKPGLTTAENLAFTARISGRKITPALDALGIGALAGLPARMLSAGQKRRLALARLSLTAAPLWLLDEPTLGVDAASVEAFGRVLAAHRNWGGVVLAATHLPLPMQDIVELRLG